MKKLLQSTFLIVLGLFFIHEFAIAQERGNDSPRLSPNALVSQTIGTTDITVTYGRPGIKDRSYFAEGSDLAPLGSVWRTGANEATTITFSADVRFGGEEVEAGTYTLFTIPGEDEWTIILNSVLTREDGTPAWGAYGYDDSKDVIRTTVDAAEGSDLEWFEIYFNELSETKAHMNIHWGTVRVPVPIETM